MPAAGMYRRVLRNPLPTLMLLVPVVLFLLARHYAATHFYRDPTSPFFDPSRAYAHMYSAEREAEALAFVAAHNRTDAPAAHRIAHDNTTTTTTSGTPWMCVGMNTVARPSGAVYARAALASFVAGLTAKERGQLFVTAMIGHADPRAHPVFGEPWLAKVADRVLTYEDSGLMTAAQRARAAELERERDRTGVPDREKHLADYTLLLRECAATGAPYVLMLEDDVLAMDGWFHRMRAAISEVEARTRDSEDGWFYLRLFHVEYGMGWDNSHIALYIFWPTVIGLGLLAAYVSACHRLARTPWGKPVAARHFWPVLRALALAFALAVYLFFTVGALSVTAAPSAPRVRELPGGGCCAQGIVFPRARVAPLARWYEEQRIGFVDTLSERLVDERPAGYAPMGGRWAVAPALVQHIGGQSSKGDNWGSDKPGQMSAAQRLHNFQFETFRKAELAAEHRRAAEAFERERVLGDG